ncbi:hypothetical protein SEA_LIBERTYBELL_79 [Streptomyces phage LibertyBell]|nr:hypothetical protein SEA_LIBERTYBELL_79 [Streptomyces phage LibertyBell]
MSDTEYYMLSTSDNPFNPHTQWDEWLAWDMGRYNSLSLLARVAKVSDELPDSVNDSEVDDAIDEIVRENVSGMHIKVARPHED